MFRIDQSIIHSPPFETLEEVQSAHLALVEQVDAADRQATTGGDLDSGRRDLARLMREIGNFEWRLAATGARLSSSEHRILAQSLLDYWALRRADLRTKVGEIRAAAGDKAAQAPRGPAPKALLAYDEASAPELADELAPFDKVLPATTGAQGGAGGGTPDPNAPGSGDEVRSRIAAAASEAGLQLSGDTITQVLRQVGVYPEPLALARWAFDWLWRRRERNRIPDAAVNDLGDPARKMAQVAEETFGALPSDDHRAAARLVFIALIGLAGEVWVRRAVEAETLGRVGGTEVDAGKVAETIVAFEQAGILTRLHANAERKESLVAAHEAVLLHWQRLRGWLSDRSREERGVALVHAAALAWSLSGSDDDLAQGEALERAAQFAERDPLVAQYVDAGRDYEQRQARAKRRFRILLQLLGAGAVVFMGLSFFAGKVSDDPTPPEIAADLEGISTAELVSSERKQADPVPDMVEPVAVDLAAAPGFAAWLWIGSAETPQLAGEDGKPLPPTSVRKGDRALLRFDMNLRPVKPGAETTKKSEAAGTATAGLFVLALDAPQVVRRADAEQFWLHAKIVPRVYFQTARSLLEPAKALRERLAARGFDLPGIEARDDVRNIAAMHEVRYYFPQDRVPAEQLAAEVNRLVGEGSGNDLVSVRQIEDKTLVGRAHEGILELWLGDLVARAAGGAD